ncbi:MAG: ABC transporter ATP-binding protein [Pseudomonadota bacterium]
MRPSASSWHLARRLYRDDLRPYLGLLALGVGLMAITAACTAALAWSLEPLFNGLVSDGARISHALLATFSLMIFGLFLLRGLATYGQAVLVSHVGRRVVANIQTRMFASLINADLGDLEQQNQGVGRRVSLFTYDVQQLYGVAAHTLTGLGKDGLTIVFLLANMFWQEPLLSLISLVLIPSCTIPIVYFGKRMRRVATNAQEHMGQLTTHVSQSFHGLRHIKAAGAEDIEITRGQSLMERAADLMLRATKVRSASHPFMEILAGLAVACVIGFGAVRIFAGESTPGSLVSFISSLLLVYEPMKRLAHLNANLQQGLAAAQRVFEAIDQSPSLKDPASPVTPTSLTGAIAFEGVCFHYPQSQRADVEGINLMIPEGSSLALVGPSGAGKSTLLDLILRFYDVRAGRITIDGIDLREMRTDFLRANIALVSQDTFLFDGTIAENIAYGNPHARTQDIQRAAEDAAVTDFTAQLPQGLATVLHDNGHQLSGGQRQRISIARALMKKAPILLLDEATSALDSKSEQRIYQTLADIMTRCTTIAIAHRLSTVATMDQICVLEDGRMIERGKHQDLLEAQGLYHRLWMLQTIQEGRTP